MQQAWGDRPAVKRPPRSASPTRSASATARSLNKGRSLKKSSVPSDLDGGPDAEKTAATRSRFILLRLALALSIITFLDRVAISSAALAIRGELHLTAVQIGWVFSAFTFAYAVFEIPSGWLGDVIGPRRVLARIVLWWSAFTAATGLAWNFTSLIAARFLFGVGEAGAFPNISRSFAKWFPQRERGSAHGVVFMGTRLGGAIAPPIVAWLMGWFGWRQSFFVFGAVGMIWCVFWLRWFCDDPATVFQRAGIGDNPKGRCTPRKACVQVERTAVAESAVAESAVHLPHVFLQRLHLVLQSHLAADLP